MRGYTRHRRVSLKGGIVTMSPEPEEEGKKPAETASLSSVAQPEDLNVEAGDSFVPAEDSAVHSKDLIVRTEDLIARSEGSTALIGADSNVAEGTAFARTQSESASARALPTSQSDNLSARTLPPSLYLPSGNNPAFLAKMSGWNWGACAFHGIWMYCFGMQLMGIIIFLATAFIPCAAFVIPIYLGLKGDDLAWRNRHFESYEQFREVIGIWNRWGIGFIVVTSTMAIGLTALLCWYLWQLMQMFTPQMCI